MPRVISKYKSEVIEELRKRGIDPDKATVTENRRAYQTVYNRQDFRKLYRANKYKNDPGYRMKHHASWRRCIEDDKKVVIEHYGGVCSCCGESRWELLTIDHTFNDGAEHRKEIFGKYKSQKFAGHKFYHWLIQNDFPPGFQVLCHNCNSAKSSFGYCPHMIDKELIGKNDTIHLRHHKDEVTVL